MNLRIVAIDDEQSALDILSKYAESTTSIKELQTFIDPIKGFHYLREHETVLDALIIDMDMPEIHGLDIVREF